MVQGTVSAGEIAGTEVETLSSCLASAQVETLLRVVLDLRLEHRRATATVEDLLRTVQPDLQPEQMSTVAFVAHALRKSEGFLADAMGELENLRPYPPEWIRPGLTPGCDR